MRLRSYNSYMPPLPTELIDYIIDYLHDSPSILRTCARVCRAWVAPSRFHLFYCLKILPTRRNAPVRLLRLLQGSPNIALYIREFHFSGRSRSDFRWPRLETVLPHLLGKLTRLRKLVLDGIPFTRLTPDTRAAFRELFALSCLVHVVVVDLKVAKPEHFTSFLCPPLKHLSVGMVLEDEFTIHPEDIPAVDEEVRAVELQKRSPSRLEYLRSDSPVFVNWLLGAQTVVDISTIRTVDARYVGRPMVRLIRRLGSSLEDLTIRNPNIKEWGTLVLIYFVIVG
jgi:hypothetical protein